MCGPSALAVNPAAGSHWVVADAGILGVMPGGPRDRHWVLSTPQCKVLTKRNVQSIRQWDFLLY